LQIKKENRGTHTTVHYYRMRNGDGLRGRKATAEKRAKIRHDFVHTKTVTRHEQYR